MKTLIVTFAFLSIFSTAAMANTYAPTLQDVVISYEDGEYSSFFSQYVLGEFLNMNMNESCQHVTVTSQKKVFCVGQSGTVLVGTVGRQISGDNASAVTVNWYSNVEILETRHNGRFFYSVKVK